MHAPVLLAQFVVLCILARLFWDGFVIDTILCFCSLQGLPSPSYRAVLFLLGNLFDLLKVIEQVMDTLGYCI